VCQKQKKSTLHGTRQIVSRQEGRAATAGKAPKAWALPRFWFSIRSHKKQPIKKILGRILGLAWLKFAVAFLEGEISNLGMKTRIKTKQESDT
jgi:hypothetical protein